MDRAVNALCLGAIVPATGCGQCEPRDIALIERTWRAALDRELPPGTAPDRVLAHFAAGNLPATFDPKAHRIHSMVELPVDESRCHCSVVTSTLATDCRFDANDRLAQCTATAAHTGP